MYQISPPPRPTGTEACPYGNAPPILIDLSSDVQEVEAVELAVRLALDVDQLQQGEQCADITELAVRQRALKTREIKSGPLMDIEREVIGVEQIQRALRAVRIGVHRHAGDIERAEQRR